MPESKSGALPLGDIPFEMRPVLDTQRIIAWVFIKCNTYFIHGWGFLCGAALPVADEAGHKRVPRSAEEEGVRADEDAGHRKRTRCRPYGADSGDS